MDVLPADPTVPGYYLRADYYELLADLRRDAPVHEFAPGMVTIARYDDIREISRDPARFCSSMGALVNDPMRSRERPPNAPSFLHMDPPDRVGFRKLVNREFTPRAIAKLEPRIRKLARAALDRTPDSGPFDFVELVAVKELDCLVLLYASGNRDEHAFGPTAGAFDVRRDTNPPHLAFGFGEHLCLGAALARMETRILFEETLSRHPNYAVVGEPDWVASSLVRGMATMPLAWDA